MEKLFNPDSWNPEERNKIEVQIKNESGGVIRIYDDYCKDNTPEDNQRIIDNVSRIINDYYIRKEVG